MVSIKEIPLLHEEECNELFSSQTSFSECYFMKPIYTFLPDFSYLAEEEKPGYLFKNLEEGQYLIGLEIISEKSVGMGFCSMLLKSYGLVLDEATPMIKKNNKRDEESFIYMSFRHIAFAGYSSEVSVY
jgi:hypothetical protein